MRDRFVLDRYVLRLWTQPAVMFLLITIGVLLLGRILRALEFVAEKGLSWQWLWLLAKAVLPYFLLLAVPVAAFVGIVALVLSMQDTSELDAARAAGISLVRLLRSVYLLGVMLWLALVWISFVWAPEGAKAASAIFHALRMQKGAPAIEAQRFNEELGALMFYADAIDETGMRGVLVEDRRGALPVVLWAKKGRMEMQQGMLRMDLADGVRFEETKKGVRIVRFASYTIVADGLGGRAFRLPLQAAASWRELWRRAQAGNHRASAELWRRMALPLELPILLMLAPVVALRGKRTAHGWVYARAIVAVLAVYQTLAASLQLAEKGWLWMPPVVATGWLLVSISLFAIRVRRS